jgi:hypothetical protein
MDFSVYSHPHTYRHAIFKQTQTVGRSAIFWALLSGPFYYWKKGARIEAILLCLSAVPLYMYDSDSSIVSYSTLWDLTTLVWLISIIGAPVILAASYRRRGWVEPGELGDMPEIPDDDSVFALRARRQSQRDRLIG